MAAAIGFAAVALVLVAAIASFTVLRLVEGQERIAAEGRAAAEQARVHREERLGKVEQDVSQLRAKTNRLVDKVR